MSVSLVVTGGYGNGTLTGSISKVVARGYTPAILLTLPEGTLTTLGYGDPTTISDIVRRNYFPGLIVVPEIDDSDSGKRRRERKKQEQVEQESRNDLSRIVRRAFSDVLGLEESAPIVAPIKVTRQVRKQIVRRAFTEIKTEGLDLRIAEIDRLVREFEQTAHLQAVQRLLDDEDAIMVIVAAIS